MQEKLRILLAEDYEVNQVVITHQLSTAGLSCTIAECGREVLELLRSENFDIILMDVHMPEGDGIETAFHIRTQFAEPVKNIPIIALTAYEGHIPTALFQAVLQKPLETQLLLQTIQACTPYVQSSVLNVQSPPGCIKPLIAFFDGNRIEVARLLADIKIQLPLDLAKLRQAADAQDTTAALAIAHRLKSLARYLDAQTFRLALQALEAFSERTMPLSSTESLNFEQNIRASLVAGENLVSYLNHLQYGDELD